MDNGIFFDGVQYISASDAASLSGWTRDYIARLCNQGKLPGKRIGKNWYVEHNSLQTFLIHQEYGKSVRREFLSRERVHAYREAVGQKHPPALSVASSRGASNENVGEYRVHSIRPVAEPARPLNSAHFVAKKNIVHSFGVPPMYERLASAVAANGSRAVSGAASLASSSTGVTDAALRFAGQGIAHVPAYAVTPLSEFAHKLVALTLAAMLTLGTYALIDPQSVQFAS